MFIYIYAAILVYIYMYIRKMETENFSLVSWLANEKR
jgi:hypothetical protein